LDFEHKGRACGAEPAQGIGAMTAAPVGLAFTSTISARPDYASLSAWRSEILVRRGRS
jgi:hypothetical protein